MFFDLKRSKILLIFRIKELTSLLDKDRDYHQRYHENLNQLEHKRKEIDEMKNKFLLEAEEKRLRISYLNTEKYELNQVIKSLQKQVENLTEINENSNRDYIDFKSQIKMLKLANSEKEEITKMSSEEVDTWRTLLEDEKKAHKLSQAMATIFEERLQSLSKDDKYNRKSILNY